MYPFSLPLESDPCKERRKEYDKINESTNEGVNEDEA